MGQFDAAVESYRQAIIIKPDYADAYYNMGSAFQEKGKLEEAIDAYNKVLTLEPNHHEALYNTGFSFQEQGKLEKAKDAYNKALALRPDHAEAYNNVGNVFLDQGKWEGAIATYNKALSIEPDYAEANNNIGVALQEQGKLEEAIEAYNKVLSIKPDYADAYNNMGNALQEQGKLEEAIRAFNKALSLKPDFTNAYNNKGFTLKDQGNLEEAIEAYNKALSLDPEFAEAHENLSFTLLNCGRWKEGFDEFEWRWQTDRHMPGRRHFSQPLWDGQESLKRKRILLWCEQGVGDTINWSSRLPLISSQADHCILECQEKLVPLLTRSFQNVEVRPEDRGQDPQRDDFDFHLPMGSLYRHFISEISDDTKPDAFLVPDPVRIKLWRQRLKSLGKGPYIGVSWKSADMSPKRMPNYAPISDWSPIFTVPDVTFVNLQYTDFSDDLIKIQNEFGVTVHDFNDLDHYDDLADVAALCAALDMVVSTKSTVPLISAGVGTVTKLANWRQSPWNNVLCNPVGPSIDIFERNTWEPWDNVLRSIADGIIKITKSGSS